jgi:hypothetical protein
MKKIRLLWICYLWVGLQASYAQEQKPTLWKSPEGKYFATFYKSRVLAVAEKDSLNKTTFYLLTNDLPASVQVQVRNSCLQKTLMMTTKKDESYGNYDLVITQSQGVQSLPIKDFDLDANYDCFKYLRDSIKNMIKTSEIRFEKKVYENMLQYSVCFVDVEKKR